MAAVVVKVSVLKMVMVKRMLVQMICSAGRPLRTDTTADAPADTPADTPAHIPARVPAVGVLLRLGVRWQMDPSQSCPQDVLLSRPPQLTLRIERHTRGGKRGQIRWQLVHRIVQSITFLPFFFLWRPFLIKRQHFQVQLVLDLEPLSALDAQDREP